MCVCVRERIMLVHVCGLMHSPGWPYDPGYNVFNHLITTSSIHLYVCYKLIVFSFLKYQFLTIQVQLSLMDKYYTYVRLSFPLYLNTPVYVALILRNCNT